MNSKYLNTVLTAIAVLLALNLWVGVHQSPASAAIDPAGEAYAQGSVTAGQQRAQMIDALGDLSEKIDALSRKLSDGSMRVQVDSMPDPHHDD